MSSRHPKMKKTAGLLLLCAVILAASVLFLFVAQNQPMFHWIENTSLGVSSSSSVTQGSSSSQAAAPSESAIKAVWEKDPDLLLVNWKYSLPENYKVSLTEKFDVKIEERLAEPYRKMAAAAKSDGITLWISSGYRAPQLQAELLEKEIEQNKKRGMTDEEAKQAADAAVAEPGHSEHNTGLAIDLNGVRPEFQYENGYKWLMQHAADYGFVLRYPKEKETITKIMFEPWHYRYVGVENAQKMKELGMCLEEYVDYLAQNEENN